MAKKITPAVAEIDPVAAWHAVPDAPPPVFPDAPPLAVNPPAAADTANIPDTAEELAGIFCSQCGEKSTAVARFCFACGCSLHPDSVGESFAVAQASSTSIRPDPGQFRPKPAAELSPAERAERERQHLAAVQAGRADPPLRYQPSTSPDKILIHFVEDGFTWAGIVWYRGQELEIGPDHPRWAEAQRWINMDDFAQMEVYGKLRFRRGPWPGKRSYADAAGSFETVMLGQGENAQKYSGPTVKELLEADAIERRRGRAVPAPTF